ncbi:glycine cleavage system protein GcvH [Aeromicrobium tamlense]|uniref:Glycine cleavage system H protein n=1 Tax=Aeromicrobium tamlense TaxID=375541 RepID=A0A8I0FVJ0_9ACTN|nr:MULTISPECIES: glycine cleavage system protein GcvH [Aeromicrobium]MBD1270508.1 glycine cleavage system protein GcvH [Aeromicrobium tamlense]MBD1271360.1 glycine cleavage system protein GcvH [Aeromicrobium tamlense]NYI37895.1 glycine cleavage system H protein [Aeromicrobium tamlense]
MIPEDLFYSEEHEWVRVEGDVAIVGITDFAQDQLGDIVYVDLPAEGDSIDAGSVVGELESTKSVSDVFTPVTGEVIARNDALEATPEVINSDPYGEGWLLKVRIADEDVTSGLLTAEAYSALVTG